MVAPEAAAGIAACLFTGTTAVPIAYAGAFAWGIAGAVFYTVAVTSLQRLTPPHAHGRVMALSSALQSASDTIGLPLAGPALAFLGIRAGALGLAGVAVVSGLAGLLAQAKRSG